MNGFPEVVGCIAIDGTLIRIQAPTVGERARVRE